MVINKSNLEKAHLTANALNKFFSQFNKSDEYDKIVLEIIFQELYEQTKAAKNRKDISLPGTKR